MPPRTGLFHFVGDVLQICRADGARGVKPIEPRTTRNTRTIPKPNFPFAYLAYFAVEFFRSRIPTGFHLSARSWRGGNDFQRPSPCLGRRRGVSTPPRSGPNPHPLPSLSPGTAIPPHLPLPPDDPKACRGCVRSVFCLFFGFLGVLSLKTDFRTMF